MTKRTIDMIDLTQSDGEDEPVQRQVSTVERMRARRDMQCIYDEYVHRCPTCQYPFEADGLGKAMICFACDAHFCLEHRCVYQHELDHFCRGNVYVACEIQGCNHTDVCAINFTDADLDAFNRKRWERASDRYGMRLIRRHALDTQSVVYSKLEGAEVLLAKIFSYV